MNPWRMLLLAGALVSLLAVPMASAGTGGTDRPFKTTLAGSVHWEYPGVSPSNCATVTTLTDAVGQVTHMGRVAASWSHCPDEPGNTADGRLTLTAPNGDRLHGRYDYDPASESNDIPIAFTGGTGRFAGASGAVVATYEIVPRFISGCNPDPDPFACMDFSVPWQWSATMTGSISY